ncbi:MAG: hypothetical protein KAT83_02570, partial [Candidatus Aenigmarchaeota archaeon]|nr:hypothetical protein [Candidatus Aenigmarchaeota archaeon]
VLFGPLLLLSAMLFLDKRYFLSGVLLGVGALTRDFGMIFLPAFILSLFLARREAAVKKAILFVAAFFLVVSPWMLHNYSHYGHFAISAPKIGVGMWQGIGEFDKEGRFGAPWGDENVAKSENASSLAYPSPFSRDSQRVKKAFEVIKEEPVWFFSIMVRRIPQFLFMSIDGEISKELRVAFIQNFDINRLPSLFVFLISEKNGLLTILMWIEQSIAYVFALLGTYFIIRKRKKEFYLFPLLIATMFSILVSHVEPRYFTPVNYFVLFIAVYGMRETKMLEKFAFVIKKHVVKRA